MGLAYGVGVHGASRKGKSDLSLESAGARLRPVPTTPSRKLFQLEREVGGAHGRRKGHARPIPLEFAELLGFASTSLPPSHSKFSHSHRVGPSHRIDCHVVAIGSRYEIGKFAILTHHNPFYRSGVSIIADFHWSIGEVCFRRIPHGARKELRLPLSNRAAPEFILWIRARPQRQKLSRASNHRHWVSLRVICMNNE